MQNLVLNRTRLLELDRCDKSFVMSLFHHGLDNDSLRGNNPFADGDDEGECEVSEDTCTNLMLNMSEMRSAIANAGGITTVECSTADMWDKEYQTMNLIAQGGPLVIMDGALSRDGNIVVGFDALIVREDGMWDVFHLSSKSSNMEGSGETANSMRVAYTEARPLMYVLSAPEHIVNVANVYVLSANKRYLTPYPDPETGEITVDPDEAMFRIAIELGDDLEAEVGEFMNHIENIYSTLAQDPFWIPEVPMGPQCNKPYRCPYLDYCTNHRDPDSVDVWLDNYWDRKRLIQNGYTTMQDLLELSYEYPTLENIPGVDGKDFTISDSGLRCLRMYEAQNL